MDSINETAEPVVFFEPEALAREYSSLHYDHGNHEAGGRRELSKTRRPRSWSYDCDRRFSFSMIPIRPGIWAQLRILCYGAQRAV